MNRNRGARRERRSYGRFGPYNEYEIYNAQETLSVLALNSNSPRVNAFLNLAYENDEKFCGTDRVPYHFRKSLFPSRSEWSPAVVKTTMVTASAIPGPSYASGVPEAPGEMGTSEKVQNSALKNDILFTIDRTGTTSNTEDGESEEKHNESNDNEFIVIDEASDEEVIVIEDNENSSSHNAELATSVRSPVDGQVKRHLSDDGLVILEYEKEETDEPDGTITKQYDQPCSEIVERLKCDLCSFHVIPDDEVKMKVHLTKEKHYAASMMEGYLYGNDFRPVYVTREMKLKAKVDVSTLVAICPVSVCSDIYPNIWSCAVHFEKKHQVTNTEGGAYGVGKVVDSGVIIINPKSQCEVCGASFPTGKALNAHWRSKIQHYPYTLPPPDQVVFFRCLYCEIIFTQFIIARHHCLTSHNDRASDSKGMRVLYVQKPGEKIPIPRRKTAPGNEDWFERANHQAEMLRITRKQPQNRFGKVKTKKMAKLHYTRAANYQQY